MRPLTAAEQHISGLVQQAEQAREERDGAQAALDLADTRWDNTRGYVADLLGRAVELADNASPEQPLWYGWQAQVEILEAVASFMDGQHDGSVTRG